MGTSKMDEIEIKRRELNEAGDRFGLHSDIVLKKSQELDVLIIEHLKESMMIRAAT